MEDDEFEWDDDKAKRNYSKHGVTFELARAAFDDPECVDREDPDPVEVRYTRLCRYGLHVFVVVWTERWDRVRIISARRANRNEQRAYYDR
jgi:uncharacterized protein